MDVGKSLSEMKMKNNHSILSYSQVLSCYREETAKKLSGEQAPIDVPDEAPLERYTVVSKLFEFLKFAPRRESSNSNIAVTRGRRRRGAGRARRRSGRR